MSLLEHVNYVKKDIMKNIKTRLLHGAIAYLIVFTLMFKTFAIGQRSIFMSNWNNEALEIFAALSLLFGALAAILTMITKDDV